MRPTHGGGYQVINTFVQQWARGRGKKPGNPSFRCGPVTVLRPIKGRLITVKVIHRFNREGKPSA